MSPLAKRPSSENGPRARVGVESYQFHLAAQGFDWSAPLKCLQSLERERSPHQALLKNQRAPDSSAYLRKYKSSPVHKEVAEKGFLKQLCI